ncbi:MAG TPA: MmgE/PrpD family protein [Acetobacteraceae bacterium]|jgi:aconitate decarboxylase|nr:MmgE/PrpD family protein [Acetobacteraceae bacterium]
MGTTAQLCDRIVATTYETLTPEAIAAARRLVLDGISIALAGTEEEAIGILAQHYRGMGARPDAVALGLGFRTAPTLAAALNGAAMHVLDFEPMWTPSNHALSTTLPAILALAAARPITGRDIITALVKGIEIQGWIRHAGHLYETGSIHFHPPGLVGPMGSAVAAGHVLGLDAVQLANALGMASSRCGTMAANIGTMTKCTHCGQAAMLGLEAAMLASHGFTANPEPFEAFNGYAKMMFGDSFQPADLLNFGPPFRIVQPGYAMKMFPSQFGTHFAITAGLTLHPQITDPSTIRSVTLTTPVMQYVNRPRPDTGLAGKFSLQYTFASGLLRGRVGIDTFTDEAVQEPAIVDLLSKITMNMSADIPARFDKMHVEADVQLADGRTLHTRCNGPRGIWGSPPISEEDHLVKVRDCLATRLPPAAAEELIALARRAEDLDAAEVGRLLTIAGCFG